MRDRIEKQVELKAPVARVWRALTNQQEFSEWFGVKLEGPFAPGQEAHGRATNRGYEHVVCRFMVREMEVERYFSFQWHPYAVDIAKDYSHETPTLVEFRLETAGEGTRLTVTESGFEKLPPERREEAFLKNGAGWNTQLRNIERYVSERP